MMYDVWFLRYGAWRTWFFIILDHFLFFYHPKNPKNQNFEKMKKKEAGDIIIHDHMLCCSWDMTWDRCNCYFLFWTIFCPFTPVTARKMKISKKWKKHLEIPSFYTSEPEIMIIYYTVPEIWHVMDVIVISHFGLFFALQPPLTAQKMKILKK